MEIKPTGINLRDKYRDRLSSGDSDFSLVDIEDAIADAA